MGNGKWTPPASDEEVKKWTPPSTDVEVSDEPLKKKVISGSHSPSSSLSSTLPINGAQPSESNSITPKYKYKWSDSQPLRTASVAPHPAKVTSKVGTVSQNTATAALAHPELYSVRGNREQYVNSLDLPEEEKKQALAQFDAHATAAEDIKRQNELIKKEPDNPEPQLKVIENYIVLGSVDQADKLSDQVIATHPTWSPAYSYKAKIQADNGNYAFGVDILNKGIEQNPADPTLYNNRASIKSQSGDYQGAIQDIDTGLKFAKNPHLIENMWVQKAIIFKKLLDASDKPDADKLIEQIYGEHNPHLDQTNKEFFLEKYQEAFNEANKYANQNKEVAPVSNEKVTPNTSATSAMEPMSEVEAAKKLQESHSTQEKVRAQAELTNKIINPNKPLANYVLEYAKEHADQVVEGLKQAGRGLVPEEVKDVDVYDKEGNKKPDVVATIQNPVQNALDVFLGSANTAFGALSLTSPEVAGFNAVTSVLPDKLNKWAFSSATSLADALGYKPTEGSVGDKALKTADLLIPLLVLHKKGAEAEDVKKIEAVEDKLKNGQELSKEDAPIIVETLREQGTEANIKKAVEASEKVEPIKTVAKEEIKAPVDEEKAASPIENKDVPEVKYEIPEKLKTETVKPEEAILVNNIPVEDIKVDPDLRSKIEERLKSGVESTHGDAPISVKYNADGSLEIMDGLHRLISKKPGETINARVFNVEQSYEKFVPAPKEVSILPAPSSVKRGDEIMVLDGEFKGQIKKVEGYGKLSHFETGDKTGGYTVFVENSKGEHVPVTHWEKVSKEESPESIIPKETIPDSNPEQISPENEKVSEISNELHDGSTGISVKAREKRAEDTGTVPTESGQGWTGKEALDRGRELITSGIDPNEMIADKNIDLHDKVAIAQAHINELGKETNAIGDKFGAHSDEYKAALKKENEYLDKVKPLSTKAHLAFAAHQGQVDIDTGTWTGLVRAFKEKTGKEMTPKQIGEAKELSGKVKELTDKYGQLEKRFTEAMNRWATDHDTAIKEALSKERTKNITKERKDYLKQSISDRLAKLGNVKYFAENASDRTNIITEVGGLIKDIAELGGLELVDAIREVIKKAPHLEKFIGENQEEIISKIEGAEKKEAKKISKEEKAKAEFERITTQFIDKKDSKFTPQEVRDIWNHAKSEYLDKGSNYPEMIRGTSIDLGLTSKQVQDALVLPKGARTINDEMYRTQRNRTQAINRAKYFVDQGNTPGWIKAIKSIPSLFFQKATFGHGTVGMQTHAGMNIFNPSGWGNYFRGYLNQFRYMKEVNYAKAMENLKNDPDFIKFIRAGLDIDPDKNYSDYEKKSLFGKFGEMGNRAFGALKVYRLETAKDYYNKLSATEKADPNTIKNISELINNATGVGKFEVSGVIGKVIKAALFAPKLIASRWNRLLIQPVRAIPILADWKNATPAQKATVKVTAKRAGEQLATLATLLAVNQGLLTASGSDKKVNITDPSKPDWLRFRAGNMALDLSGGMVGTAQFVARLIQNLPFFTSQAELGRKTRKEKYEIAAGNYIFNTLSPVASTIAEPVLEHDFNGNTVPWSDEKPLGQGHKLTWKEFLWAQAPIPAAEAAKDMYQSMQDRGMSEPQIQDILTGIMRGGISGFTGARLMEISENRKQQYKDIVKDYDTKTPAEQKEIDKKLDELDKKWQEEDLMKSSKDSLK